MIDISKIDYSVLDRSEVLLHLFHPRPEQGRAIQKTTAQDILIPVEENAVIGARFHMKEKSAQNILFFHGNGEIVADYDDLGDVYNKMGNNFFAVDYRGYGRSTGKPTITNMMRDCHVIFDFTKNWLMENGYSGFFIIMGRSLGSASAIEIAASYEDEIDGLIIESGFAYAGPLLQLLGINLEAIGFKESESFWNLNKIQAFERPTLIIHAELDHIIPFSDGQALYNASQSPDKTMLKIPGANHNNIFQLGFSEYMEAVKNLMNKVV